MLWGRYTLRLFVDGELAATEVLEIENPLNLIWASPGMHVLTTARPSPQVLEIENPLKLFGSASSLPNGVLKAVSRVNAKAALEQVRHS